jgi:DNA-binding CsgD family transcriptional regulator
MRYVRGTGGYRPCVPAGLERRVLALVGDVIGMLDLEELSHGLLVALRDAVPSDWSAINELPADLPRTVSLTDPVLPREMHERFARYGLQNPLAQRYLATGNGRATRFSDVVTRRELHRLELYRHVYRPLGVEYQIAFMLPSAARRVLGVTLSRSTRDFTATERDLLNLARPYLIQVYRNALSHTALEQRAGRLPATDLRVLGLTRRQAEVLRLVAMGRSDQDVATTLGIGLRTVHKHLEHCYRALGVRTRSQASRAAWGVAGAGD